MVTMQDQNVHTLKYTDCNQKRIQKKPCTYEINGYHRDQTTQTLRYTDDNQECN